MDKRIRVVSLFVLLLFGGIAAFSQAPLPPQNLKVEGNLIGGAALSWDASAGATEYWIYKSVDRGNFAKIAMVHNTRFLDLYVFPGFPYHYYVTAAAMMHESAPSDTVPFMLGHHRPPFPNQSVIRGKVTDDLSGLPLPFAVVRFFKQGQLMMGETFTDTGGVYWAPLDTGSYVVRAEKFGYIGEWYDNAHRIDSASVINLGLDTITADFSLQRIPPPVPVTVSGTVTDDSTHEPLPNTFVAFLRPPRWLRELEMATGMFGGLPFERFDFPVIGRLFGVVWFGLTDDSGRYSAHVPKGLRYIAFAFKPGYVPQYYNKKYSPLHADRLYLTNDTSGIDFDLQKNGFAIHSIAGMVEDSSGTGIPSHVILYRKNILGRVPVRFTMTDSLGNFEFHDLVNGLFYVKAIPVDGYAPAWHSDVNCGVKNWRFADSVLLSGNVPGGPTGINVCVISSPHSGFGRIAGSINRSSGSLLTVSPEQAVTVYAVSTSSNEVVGYDITEEDGSYSIDNVPAGTYDVIVDKEGFASVSSPQVVVDQSNNYEVSDVSVILNPVTLSVGGEENIVPGSYRLAQNYPNPFNPTTIIAFELSKASFVTLKVYNILGQEVATILNEKRDAGQYSLEFNAAHLTSGIYFYRIQAGDFSQTKKLVLLK